MMKDLYKQAQGVNAYKCTVPSPLSSLAFSALSLESDVQPVPVPSLDIDIDTIMIEREDQAAAEAPQAGTTSDFSCLGTSSKSTRLCSPSSLPGLQSMDIDSENDSQNSAPSNENIPRLILRFNVDAEKLSSTEKGKGKKRTCEAKESDEVVKDKKKVKRSRSSEKTTIFVDLTLDDEEPEQSEIRQDEVSKLKADSAADKQTTTKLESEIAALQSKLSALQQKSESDVRRMMRLNCEQKTSHRHTEIKHKLNLSWKNVSEYNQKLVKANRDLVKAANEKDAALRQKDAAIKLMQAKVERAETQRDKQAYENGVLMYRVSVLEKTEGKWRK